MKIKYYLKEAWLFLFPKPDPEIQQIKKDIKKAEKLAYWKQRLELAEQKGINKAVKEIQPRTITNGNSKKSDWRKSLKNWASDIEKGTKEQRASLMNFKYKEPPRPKFFSGKI